MTLLLPHTHTQTLTGGGGRISHARSTKFMQGSFFTYAQTKMGPTGHVDAHPMTNNNSLPTYTLLTDQDQTDQKSRDAPMQAKIQPRASFFYVPAGKKQNEDNQIITERNIIIIKLQSF